MVDVLIKGASQLLTMSGSDEYPVVSNHLDALGIIEDGAIALDGGKVVAVGTTRDVTSSVEVEPDTRVFNARGKVVMPGFVDPHTHACFAGTREDELVAKIKGASYLEILESGGGILRTVRATRQAHPDVLKQQTAARLERMLDFGTTTAEVKSGYGLDLETEKKMLSVIAELDQEHPVDLVPTYMGAHAVPGEFKGNPDNYVEFIVQEVLPTLEQIGMARFCDVFCEKGAFDREQSRRVLEAAKSRGMTPKVHADEIENMGGSGLAAELGAISAEHLVKTSEGEMEAMAEKGVIGCLLPGTPFVLMHQEYPKANLMVEKGMPIALATDLNPNCWTESMQMVMTLACLQMRMPPEVALVAGTINAACAIGMEGQVGSLEAGKKGDVLVLDVPNYMHVPYHFGVNLVEIVFKDGRQVRGEV